MPTSTPATSAQPLNFRRYKDGDTQFSSWQKKILDGDHS